MFEGMTYQNIMRRMLSRVPEGIDKREGSVIWDALAPAALELEMGYITLEYALMQGFADTAERDYLIRKCAERAIRPLPATQALLRGVFLPQEIDVRGKRFSLGELNFVAEEPEGADGQWRVRCETAGSEGNRHLGALIPIEYVAGLESARLTDVLIPGEDEEDTEALRQRYFDSFGILGMGGNVREYMDVIEPLPGVGGVRITRRKRGERRFRATIIDSEFGAASDALIQSVQAVVDPLGDEMGEGLAAIGHVVTVDTPEAVPISVTARMDFLPGYSWEMMREEMLAVIEGYLLELRRGWGSGQAGEPTVVRLSQLETRLLAVTGVLDVRDLTINGQRDNLVIAGDGIPVMGGLERAEG